MTHRFLTGMALAALLLASSVASAFHDHDQEHRSSETQALCTICLHEDTLQSVSLVSPLAVVAELDDVSRAAHAICSAYNNSADLVSFPRGPPA